jgi:hypothetical protein
MKKLWERPRLIVLVRGKPEENVFITCKHYLVPTEGPNATDSACVTGDTQCSMCVTYTET